MDGSVVCTGVSRGLWGNSNPGGSDFAAAKLDENGTEVWRWQVTIIGYPSKMPCLLECTGGAIQAYHEWYLNVSEATELRL